MKTKQNKTYPTPSLMNKHKMSSARLLLYMTMACSASPIIYRVTLGLEEVNTMQDHTEIDGQMNGSTAL